MPPGVKVDTGKIAALADSVALDEGVEVFDVEVVREGPRTVIRIFIDREGGVGIGDCESFSRRFGAVLDVEDPVPGPYALEVSSPGVNRRLSRPRHFEAALGRRLRVSLAEPLGGSRNFSGILARTDDDGIDIERDGKAVHLPYRLMRKANIDVTQDELFGKGKKKR
ncbi:MAG: ribosome maturation factor RimP [Gemmatimonadota bacterium]